jgi:hypothetical protein
MRFSMNRVLAIFEEFNGKSFSLKSILAMTIIFLAYILRGNPQKSQIARATVKR